MSTADRVPRGERGRSAGGDRQREQAPRPPLMALQQAVGNAAMGRALMRAEVPEGMAEGQGTLDPEQAAEVHRLEGEIKKLAQRNAWSGVLRNYVTLEEIGPEHLTHATHYLAAQGEKNENGWTPRYLALLNRTIDGPASDEGNLDDIRAAREAREQLFTGFREIWIAPEGGAPEEEERGGGGLLGGISGGGRGGKEGPAPPTAELGRDDMPFAPDQRLTIEKAKEALAAKGWFRGYLPFGNYTLNGEPLVVDQGASVLRVTY